MLLPVGACIIGLISMGLKAAVDFIGAGVVSLYNLAVGSFIPLSLSIGVVATVGVYVLGACVLLGAFYGVYKLYNHQKLVRARGSYKKPINRLIVN